MGDPLLEDTKIGAMISEGEAIRVAQWIDEAVAAGARVMIGGDRDGAKLSPTVVADVTSSHETVPNKKSSARPWGSRKPRTSITP